VSLAADGAGAAPQLALSADGTLVYISPVTTERRSLVILNAKGREEPLPELEAGNYRQVRFSPDGHRLVFDNGSPTPDVWTYDLERRTKERITSDPASDRSPLWTPDSQRVVFYSTRGNAPGLFLQSVDGSGTPQRLLTADPGVVLLEPDTWAANPLRLLFTQVSQGKAHVKMMPIDPPGPEQALLQADFSEMGAAMSPDSKWLAYHSDQTGRFETYIVRFPSLTERHRVSSHGGLSPRWSGDGRSLFYMALDGRRVFKVPIGPDASPGAETVAIEGSFVAGTSAARTFDVAPDGRLVLVREGQAERARDIPDIIVVLNWFEELKARVPTK